MSFDRQTAIEILRAKKELDRYMPILRQIAAAGIPQQTPGPTANPVSVRVSGALLDTVDEGVYPGNLTYRSYETGDWIEFNEDPDCLVAAPNGETLTEDTIYSGYLSGIKQPADPDIPVEYQGFPVVVVSVGGGGSSGWYPVTITGGSDSAHYSWTRQDSSDPIPASGTNNAYRKASAATGAGYPPDVPIGQTTFIRQDPADPAKYEMFPWGGMESVTVVTSIACVGGRVVGTAQTLWGRDLYLVPAPTTTTTTTSSTTTTTTSSTTTTTTSSTTTTTTTTAPVMGCTDSEALNYDPAATDDDGSCVYESYNCVDGVCTDPGDGTGTYTTSGECDAACTTPVSYDCVDGSCVDPGDGSGAYPDDGSCDTTCFPVSYNCVDGVCVDPGDGTGTFSDLSSCSESCL